VNTIETTECFDVWFNALSDPQAAYRITMRLRRAELGNFGDVAPVGEGVSEMRIHYGPGYRIYFTRAGLTVYVLLAGGDKATQKRDIAVALDWARQLKERKED
jgi:putative addiction module killer protein